MEQRSRLHRTAEGHALIVTGRKPMQSQTSTKPRNTTNSTPPSPGILVSDFDGTITTFDFYDLVSREFPEIAGSYWQQYEAGGPALSLYLWVAGGAAWLEELRIRRCG